VLKNWPMLPGKAEVTAIYVTQVIFIVSHSGMVEQIINALGGDGNDCAIGDEYDNLCIVTIDGSGKTNVVNLQYGEQSP